MAQTVIKRGTRVRVDVESESVLNGNPARVFVYEDGQLISEVIAKIEPQQGADGGYYRSVVLQERQERRIPSGNLKEGPCSCDCHDSPGAVHHVLPCCTYSYMGRAEAEEMAVDERRAARQETRNEE